MENSRNSSLVVRHGAVWLTMLGMAVGGIWWAAGLAGKVENQQVQISVLQATVSERSRVLNLVESMQRDVTKIGEQAGADTRGIGRVPTSTGGLPGDHRPPRRAHRFGG